MRKVKANLSELIDAFDDCRIGDEFYLGVKAGKTCQGVAGGKRARIYIRPREKFFAFLFSVDKIGGDLFIEDCHII
jgi:hypothetical protein